MKADTKTDTKASDSKASDNATGAKSGAAADSKPNANSATTGQGASASAGARANLSTEQRTTIKTVIREQKVAPVTNVNFSISVGTRIPREVRHHPLPPRVISVYPAWRGYEYILVGNDIIVIDPRTLEIVAVLDA